MTTILDAPRAWLESSPTRWYIVFCDTERRAWWDVLFHTRPGFTHCYALRWDGFNWLFYNPHASFTEIAILPATSENALASMLEPEATVVEVEAFRKYNRIRGRWWAGPMTCVEQIKALIGVPVGRVWTPWQLYRYLMEECAREHFQKAESPGTKRPGQRAGAPPAIRARRFTA